MSGKFEIDSEFTKQELASLMDALDEWENKHCEMLELIHILREMGDPPVEDNPDLEDFANWREHMISRELDLRKDREIRREKTILLKAKIILANQRKAAQQICDESSS